jgi:chemotaxis protein CheD
MLISKVGSGVVICIHDPEANIGGLLHILMPEDLLEAFPRIEKGNTGFAYIENVIEDFINSLKRHGAGKKRIRIKLYGGSSIVEEVVDSGLKNYVFAKEWLMRKGLLIASEDIGGKSCRRIMFLAHKGKVHCYKMRRKKDIEELREKEKEFMDQVMQQTQS